MLKGILTAEDARLAADAGIDGIVVSNHGGRIEDGVSATITVLPEIVEAVGGRMPVLVDSGFRRGSDIVKALAIGARAVCIGRPYLWGLGAFGQPGVERVLGILRNETRTAMQQLGAPSLKDLTPAMVRRVLETKSECKRRRLVPRWSTGIPLTTSLQATVSGRPLYTGPAASARERGADWLSDAALSSPGSGGPPELASPGRRAMAPCGGRCQG